LANWIGFARPLSAASSENRGASWVHPTVSGAPSAAIARKRSSSARQSWVAVVVSPRQPRLIAPASRGIVSPQEQIRRCLVESAIALTIFCSWTVSSGGGGNWPELPGRNSRKVYTNSIEERDAGVADGHPLHPAQVFRELEIPLSSGVQVD
jgi:hypothetical protein